jgi:predicted GIY-YIG superfamily endonuclease
MAGKPSATWLWLASFMSFVYILRSEGFPNQYYSGLTDDVRDRLSRHNRGEIPSTARYIPWKLIFYCAFPGRVLAADFESYLKTGSGRAFVRRHIVKKLPP